MNFEEYRLDDAVLCRYDQVYNTYKQMYGDPDHREPKFIAVLPSEYNPVWEERLADPAIMLKAELESLKPHIGKSPIRHGCGGGGFRLRDRRSAQQSAMREDPCCD